MTPIRPVGKKKNETLEKVFNRHLRDILFQNCYRWTKEVKKVRRYGWSIRLPPQGLRNTALLEKVIKMGEPRPSTREQTKIWIKKKSLKIDLQIPPSTRGKFKPRGVGCGWGCVGVGLGVGWVGVG